MVAGNEDRAKPYRDWHREQNAALLAMDIDQIELRYKHGKLYPVALIEITRLDGDAAITDRYLQAVLARFRERDLQGTVIRNVAKCLHVPAFLVLFRQNCREFWVYRLTGQDGWQHKTEAEYAAFLADL
jgi:hypothetical protein